MSSEKGVRKNYPHAENHPDTFYAPFYAPVLIGTGSCVTYALHVRSGYMEAFYLPSNSCYPTVMQGDRVLANKAVYDRGEPQRGDLIVFRSPENRHARYLKRIVATEGDTVEVKDGQLYVNGGKCTRQDLGARTVRSQGREVSGRVCIETNGSATYPVFVGDAESRPAQAAVRVTVPKHHCFVLGDNRPLSTDSREFGPIPLTSVIGRVDYVYWPADGWSRFGRLTGRPVHALREVR